MPVVDIFNQSRWANLCTTLGAATRAALAEEA